MKKKKKVKINHKARMRNSIKVGLLVILGRLIEQKESEKNEQ